MATGAATQALIALLFGPSVIQSLTGLYPPFNVELNKKTFKVDPAVLPGAAELVGMAQKGIIGTGDFQDKMQQLGFDFSQASAMLQNARTYLSALDYITAWRRGIITEGQCDEALQEQGLNAVDRDALKQVTIYFPTPQDLIRFGVRDVFTESTIKTYGLDQDYPDLLDKYAVQAGLTPEISRWYWMAHWFLPSNTEIFDMLHRRIINEDDVKTFLKVNDYMPYWRDKLIQLSYDPLTRVDVRRMYKFGVLSEQEVHDAYLDLGYSEDNASRLTRFTVAENNHSTESTPSSTAIAAYKAGTFDKGQTIMALEKAGISSDTANVMIEVADANIQQELIDLEANAIADQYRNGLITLNDFQTQLTKLGVPSRLLNLTVQRELAQSKQRAKNATKSDLDNWWKRGVIGDSAYKTRMGLLGYSTDDISRYLQELKLDYIIGADKKWSFSQHLRDYSDGLITRDGLSQLLQSEGYDPSVIADIQASIPAQKP